MKQVSTAEDFMNRPFGQKWDTQELMIEFAKLHVEAALKEADAQAEHLLPEGCWDLLEDVNFILNSYPESNIK